MAGQEQTDFSTAFAALKDGQAVRRAGWTGDVRWTWFAGSETSDASVVEVSDGPPPRKVAIDSIGLKDLMAADWTILDGGA